MAERHAGHITPAPCPSAIETARAVSAGQETAHHAVAAAIRRTFPNEAEVAAFEFLDTEVAFAAADALDRAGPSGRLAGVPIGVKDVFDTADMPTRNGCIHEYERRPEIDATVVARLRRQGAIVFGKTTTTECAYYHPTKTRNPLDLGRTPGGSSSGSAAAIAAGMVPVALGSQTAGSIIRPAAYCGVWGMKPSFGLIPRTGVLTLGHSLDHVGTLAGSIEDVARVIDVMSGDDGHDPASFGRAPSRLEHALSVPLDKPRLAFVRSFAWPEIEPDTARRFEALAASVGAIELDMGPSFADAFAAHRCIMSCEMAYHLWSKYLDGGDLVSQPLRRFLIEGRSIGAERYLAALDSAARMKVAVERLLRPYDGVITPAATSEAPLGLGHTGSRAFCLLWTMLGVPAVQVPGLKGEAGLPLGVQVVGAFNTDAETLRTAAWVSRAIAAGSA